MEPVPPQIVQYFKGHTGPITSLSFNPNGKSLASSSEDNSFLVWNLSSNKNSLRYQAKALPVTHVAYSPLGDRMASSQGDYVRIWMASVQGKSIEFKPHLGTVRSVEFSLDGEKLLTASNDKSVKLWVTCRRRFLSSFTGHTNWVKLAKYSPDGDMIVSCSDDRTARLWDPNSSKCIHTFTEVKGTPRYVNFHPFGNCIGLAMSHGATKLYDLRTMRLLQFYECHSSQVNGIAFHPSGSFMITASDDCTNKVIDLYEGRVIFNMEAHSKAVTAVEFSRKGDLFATASEDKNIVGVCTRQQALSPSQKDHQEVHVIAMSDNMRVRPLAVFVWVPNFENELEKTISESRRCLRESVANNYDPDRPKIQLKASSLSLNTTQIEDVYSPKDYEDTPQKTAIINKENERGTGCRNSRVTGTPRPNEILNRTSGDEMLSLLDSLTHENEMLREQVSTLQNRVDGLEKSEDSFKKKLLALEERLSHVEVKSGQMSHFCRSPRV